MAAEAPQILLVHGLWYRAWSMRVLAGRLRAGGLGVRTFSYATRTGRPVDHALALAETARGLAARELHLVGHSLGGLVILQMLRQARDLPPGKVVLLGTPLRGSVVARRSRWLPGGGMLLGRAAELLARGADGLPGDRAIGMIAGVRPFGLGRLVGGLEAPHDGTVAARETQHEGLAAWLQLPLTHTGLLIAPRVVTEILHFVRSATFSDA